MTNMSPAQQAQQRNRDRSGQYQARLHQEGPAPTAPAERGGLESARLLDAGWAEDGDAGWMPGLDEFEGYTSEYSLQERMEVAAALANAINADPTRPQFGYGINADTGHDLHGCNVSATFFDADGEELVLADFRDDEDTTTEEDVALTGRAAAQLYAEQFYVRYQRLEAQGHRLGLATRQPQH